MGLSLLILTNWTHIWYGYPSYKTKSVQQKYVSGGGGGGGLASKTVILFHAAPTPLIKMWICNDDKSLLKTFKSNPFFSVKVTEVCESCYKRHTRVKPKILTQIFYIVAKWLWVNVILIFNALPFIGRYETCSVFLMLLSILTCGTQVFKRVLAPLKTLPPPMLHLEVAKSYAQ